MDIVSIESIISIHFKKFTENFIPNDTKEFNIHLAFIKDYIYGEIKSSTQMACTRLFDDLKIHYDGNDISSFENSFITFLSQFDDKYLIIYLIQKEYDFLYPDMCDLVLSICHKRKEIFPEHMQDFQKLLFFEIIEIKEYDYIVLDDIFNLSTLSFDSVYFACYFSNMMVKREMKIIARFYNIFRRLKLYDALLLCWGLITINDRLTFHKFITPFCSYNETRLILRYFYHWYFSLRMPELTLHEYHSNIINLFNLNVRCGDLKAFKITRYISTIMKIFDFNTNLRGIFCDTYKYYIEILAQKISLDDCSPFLLDYAKEVISEDETIIVYFIDMVCRYCSTIKRKNIFESMGLQVPVNYPLDIAIRVVQPSNNWYTNLMLSTSNYITTLDLNNIIFVTNCKELESMMNKIFVKGNIIGFDSEWNTSNFQTNVTTLFQLAVKDEIYLIDVIALSLDHFKGSDLMKTFFHQLFHANDHICLAFSINNDIRVIRETFPVTAADLIIDYGSFIDLQKYASEIFHSKEVIDFYISCYRKPEMANPSDFSNKGLSFFMDYFTGKSINKDSQRSNWSRRPLSPAQVYYAAMDSYCLLELYNNMRQIQETIKKNFRPVKKIAKTYSPRQSDEAPNRASPIPLIKLNMKLVHQCFFICDSMYDKLCNHLRMCGADTLLMKTDRSLRNMNEQNVFHGRILITSSSRLDYFLTYPKGLLTSLTINRKETTICQLIDLLVRTNLKIDRQQILTRCSKCNSGALLEVPTSILKEYKDRGRHVNVLQAFNRCDKTQKVIQDHSEAFILEYSHIQLDVDSLIPSSFCKYNVMKCCCSCGKIFYDGSHCDRFISKLIESQLVENT